MLSVLRPRRASLSLRVTLLCLALVAGTYAGALPVYLVTHVRAATRRDRATGQSELAAGRLTHEYLLARDQALEAAVTEALRVTLLWLVLGGAAIALTLSILRRRIWDPLRELETGLARVAEGDLNTALPVRRADEVGRLVQHFNDMTRVLRDRAEEQGRFAAAGELLGGVAHEVSNPLMAIAVHAENRLADPTISEEHRGEMTQILRQTRRATKLLRGLLRFVRATERQVAHVNLNEVVRGALDLVSYRFGVDEVTVGGHLDATLPPVEGDAIKLEQVVVNLLANAIDALRAIQPPRQLTVDTGVSDDRPHPRPGAGRRGRCPLRALAAGCGRSGGPARGNGGAWRAREPRRPAGAARRR